MLYHLLCYDTLKSMIGGKESQITNINWYQTQSISTIPSSTQLLLILPITSLFLQQAVGTSSRGLTSQFIKSNALVANQADTRPFTTGTSILGIKYNGGVVPAANPPSIHTASFAKYKNTKRLLSVNSGTVALGKYSTILDLLCRITLEDRLRNKSDLQRKSKSASMYVTQLLS